MVLHRHGASETARRRLAHYGAPAVLFAVLIYLSRLGPPQRDLDLVELFSGAGALASAFSEHSMNSEQFDVCHDPLHDIRRVSGFLKAVQLVLRLKVGALLWAGTPCSTWVWISRSSTGRSRGNPLGRTDQHSVSDANVTVSRVALLVLLAVARGACWAIEQPASSLMPEHPRMQMLVRLGPRLGLDWEHIHDV